ncbi:MAG: hypothetical protein K9K64_10755, partial [Desulfohalobiaceae bacterium]|nr:hypothetical protein [Desulfohalobiaceae bacterium]
LLFPRTRGLSLLCKGGTCFISGLAALALVLINIQQFLRAGWTTWTWVSLGALPLLFLFCAFMSRRAACWKEEG